MLDIPAWTSGTVALDSIVHLPRNPKDHDVGLIIQSIQRWGFVDPMVINRRTGYLIAGHGRDKALVMMREQGMTAPDGIQVDSSIWRVPVYAVDVPADQEEALAIALNRSTEMGGWDEPMLTKVLSDLAAQGEDALHGTGYDLDDVNVMLGTYTFSPEEEWDNMPEFVQEELGVFHTIKVHFKTLDDLSAFAKLIEQNISEQTTFIYYPKQINEDLTQYKVIDES